MPENTITARVDNETINQINELKKYYKNLWGVDITTTDIIKMSIRKAYQKSLYDNVRGKNNKKTDYT